MQTCQSLIIVCAIDADVPIDILAEGLAYLSEDRLITVLTHRAVRKVSVHTGAIPVQLFT
jgi:hypothetical protein